MYSSHIIIGLSFFGNAIGGVVTVNGISYRQIITENVSAELSQINLKDMWFWQVGGKCHFKNYIIPFYVNCIFCVGIT